MIRTRTRRNEKWNIGVMEYWSNGFKFQSQYSTTPPPSCRMPMLERRDSSHVIKRRKRTADPSGARNAGGGDAPALLVAGGLYRARSRRKDSPTKVRLLGEDLILFRDGSGRLGILGLHCSHRGTSLEFGRVEDSGIRCCYHGWLYDVGGKCLEHRRATLIWSIPA